MERVNKNLVLMDKKLIILSIKREIYYMRTPYLVTDGERSYVYTDKRKVNKMFIENEDIKVYSFKTIDRSKRWEDAYEIIKNEEEIRVQMFEEDGCTYSELGCKIMEWLAKAEWNTSIKYPTNGWHICSECGSITNEIDTCKYCGEFVCWECSYSPGEWDEGCYCSYDCYRYHLEERCNIPYNPELEYEEKVCNRLEHILPRFSEEELFNILIHIESDSCDEEELEEINQEHGNMTEEELLDVLQRKDEYEVYSALMELYEDDTENYLSDILDAEAFINNLDPNDPADEWFFED